MGDYKPNDLPTNLLCNLNNGISFLCKLPHRFAIETKLVRKASLIQLKHRFKISGPVLSKKNLAAHQALKPERPPLGKMKPTTHLNVVHRQRSDQSSLIPWSSNPTITRQ